MSRQLLIIPFALLLLAGCSGGGASTSGGADHANPAAGVASAPTSVSGSSTTSNLSSQVALQQREIVRNATLDMTVSDVDHAADAAVSATVAAGGRTDTDDRNSSGSDRHAHLVLRVPGDKLSGLIDTVAHSGHENSRTNHGEDATAATADVSARVDELRISVARLQDFLSKSGSISDLVSLETQLTQRESELQSTIAQQRALADQVSLASLTVDFGVTLPPVAKSHGGPPGFGAAVIGSWHGLLTSLRVVAAGLGYGVPFAIVLIPLGFVLLRLSKRLRPSPTPLSDQT